MSTRDFNHAVTDIYPTLNPYAIRLTKNVQDAKDLIQETVLRALKNKEKYRHDSNLKAWLLIMMRNIFINGYRKKAKRNTVLDDSDNSYLLAAAKRVDNDALSNFVIDDIMRAISKIPETYQVPLMMMYEGYKYQEIAEAIDVPLGTVKSRIFWARKKLVDDLKVYQPRQD